MIIFFIKKIYISLIKMTKIYFENEYDDYDDCYDYEDDYSKYYKEFDYYSQYEKIPFSRWYYGKIASDVENVEEQPIYDYYNYYNYEFEDEDSIYNKDYVLF